MRKEEDYYEQQLVAEGADPILTPPSDPPPSCPPSFATSPTHTHPLPLPRQALH